MPALGCLFLCLFKDNDISFIMCSTGNKHANSSQQRVTELQQELHELSKKYEEACQAKQAQEVRRNKRS